MPVVGQTGPICPRTSPLRFRSDLEPAAPDAAGRAAGSRPGRSYPAHAFAFIVERVDLAVIFGGREIDLGQRLARAVHVLFALHFECPADGTINLDGISPFGCAIALHFAPVLVAVVRAIDAGGFRRLRIIVPLKPEQAIAAVHPLLDQELSRNLGDDD